MCALGRTYSEWRPGDLIVWDNLAVMHARSSVDHTQRREMLRVLLRGPEGGLRGAEGSGLKLLSCGNGSGSWPAVPPIAAIAPKE